jgi:hypothetical protein
MYIPKTDVNMLEHAFTPIRVGARRGIQKLFQDVIVEK